MKSDGPREKNRRGRTALQIKRPGGKERAGGPERRIQNRQKIPCTFPMNRGEDIHIPCTVGRMKKGPPRSRSLLVHKIMRARCRTRRPSLTKSIAWCSKKLGVSGGAKKGQEAFHMGGDAVYPSGVCEAQANGRLRGLATEGGHCVFFRRVRLFSSFQTLNTYLRCP